MSELRLDEAEWYLLNAKANGVKEAIANLAILPQLREAVRMFEALED